MGMSCEIAFTWDSVTEPGASFFSLASWSSIQALRRSHGTRVAACT